jgi:prevent-host-death family protein
MAKQYSIVQAKDHLPSLLRQVERGQAVELTRRGKPVAVVLSVQDFARLQSGGVTFTQALSRLRRKKGFRGVDLAPDFYDDLRDRSPGRKVNL